jgi:geranylgeranyl pyrophosphate synthase
MQLGFKPKNTEKDSLSRLNTDQLLNLPGLCCQAVGGDPRWADDLAAAWFLFYIAAHLMDGIQDQDPIDPIWGITQPGTILSVASGYFFTASKILNLMKQSNAQNVNINQIIDDIYDYFLIMCSGQYRDLSLSEHSIKSYWEIAEAKSGTFFKIACRSGAALATKDPVLLDGYGDFGFHFGLLVQIYDDLEEIERLKSRDAHKSISEIKKSIPMVYAMETLPQKLQNQLLDCLNYLPNRADEVVDILDQSGAGLYVEIEIQKHRDNAIRAINKVSPRSPAGEMILSYLPDIS